MTTDATLHFTSTFINANPAETSTTDTYTTGFSAPAKGTFASGLLMWVKAGQDLDQGEDVYLSSSVSTGVVTAAKIDTATSGSTVNDIAIVHKDIASGSYGWVWVGPFVNVEVLTTVGITAGTPLTTHSVAGTVSTGGDVIAGLTCIETSIAGLTQCTASAKLRTN